MLHNIILALERQGRFIVKEFLGRGGGGELYLAYDNVLKRKVAIKFVVSEDEETKEQLLKEARFQAQLSHDNICKIYEVGRIENIPFIIMQYINGNSLMYYYDKLNIEQKVKMFIKICDALRHAHQSGIIHRDIKPSNILVEEIDGEYKPYLIDFGLAKKKDTTTTTATGNIVGSPYFMSPEQASGLVHNIDRRSDIYSLGATLYAFITGKPPFYNKNSISAIYSIMKEEPELPSKINPHIPKDIETIIVKCMMKEPSLRYPSVNEVERDLERFLKGEPIAASKPSIFYKLKRRAKQNPLAVSILFASLLIIMLLTGFYVKARVEEKKKTEYIVNFVNKTKEIENLLKTQYLLPIHNIDGERKKIFKEIENVIKVAEPLNARERALAYIAVGKCYFYLEEEDNALSFLEKGWKYFKEKDTALKLSILYFKRYNRLLNRVGEKKKKGDSLDIKMNLYRKKALAYLDFYGIKDPLSKGLREYFEGNYKKAAIFFENAIKEKPDFYISLIFEGDCYKKMYIENARKDYKSAEGFFKKAEQKYKEAIRVARSDPQCYVSMSELYNAKMHILIYQSDINLKDFFKRSIAYCKKAISISSMYKRAYESMIFAYWRYTEFLAYYYPEKSKVNKLLDKGISLCSTSLKLFPDSNIIYSSYLTLLSIYFQFNLDDPYEKGLEKLKLARYLQKKVAKKFPYDRNIMYQRAILYGTSAEWKWWNNIFAEDDLKKAVELYTKIIDSKSGMEDAYHNRAVDLMFLARGYYHFRGLNPKIFLERAQRDFSTSLKLLPRDYPTFINRGFLSSLWYDFSFQNSNDCERYARLIIDDGKAAIKITPLYSYGYQILTKGYFRMAMCEKEKEKAYRYKALAIKNFKILKSKTENIDNMLDEYRFAEVFVAYKFKDWQKLRMFSQKWQKTFFNHKDLRDFYYIFNQKGETLFFLSLYNGKKGIEPLEKLVSQLKPYAGKKYLSDISLGDCAIYLAYFYKKRGDKKYKNYLETARGLIRPYIKNPVVRTAIFRDAINLVSGSISKGDFQKSLSKSAYLSVKYSFLLN